MQTKKVTVKEMVELKEFKAVNRKGDIATISANEDGTAAVQFEDGSSKIMKLDSIRRSWLLVVEQEESKKEEENEMEEIKVGYIVKDSRTEEVGEVKDIQGRVVTVENKKGDFPADIGNLEIVEKKEVEQPKEKETPNNVVELNPVEKPQTKKVEKPKAPKAPQDDEEFKKPNEVAPDITTEHNGIHLLNYEVAMGRKHEKSITDIAIDQHLMRIKQNGAYIMDVSLYDVNGNHVYKAKNMSLKDALEFMGYEGERMKEARKAITNLRKAARQQATIQAQE